MQIAQMMHAWMQQVHANGAQALASLQQEWLSSLAAHTQDEVALAKAKARMDFAREQLVAATQPDNFFAFNQEAIDKALQTQGQSVQKGIENMLLDLQKGAISLSDDKAFALGVNIAATEGAVVFENDLFQLIEYKPLTPKVFTRPLLLVPPCINKFYILDLQPHNSLVRYALTQGHRTFVVSWRNPDAHLANKTWDDYVQEAVLQAIDVVSTIAQVPQINTLGFCVGGTLLVNALAVLAAKGDHKVASATCLTTLMDFTHAGVLGVFIDENAVKAREVQFAKGGLLNGRELAATFSFLRPQDLVYHYMINNYLKGETPPAFDLLFWNGDCTHLPGRFYSWYLRNTYLENNLIKPKHCTVAGEPIDLRTIDVPTYLYGSREDHIVPVEGAYASTQVLRGRRRFVMGASGHIAGVINSPVKNKRSYWKREDGKLPKTYAQWLEGATEHPGSWWGDWAAWLKTHAGKPIVAPARYGRGKFKAIEPAPGRYVKVRV